MVFSSIQLFTFFFFTFFLQSYALHCLVDVYFISLQLFNFPHPPFFFFGFVLSPLHMYLYSIQFFFFFCLRICFAFFSSEYIIFYLPFNSFFFLSFVQSLHFISLFHSVILFLCSFHIFSLFLFCIYYPPSSFPFFFYLLRSIPTMQFSSFFCFHLFIMFLYSIQLFFLVFHNYFLRFPFFFLAIYYRLFSIQSFFYSSF